MKPLRLDRVWSIKLECVISIVNPSLMSDVACPFCVFDEAKRQDEALRLSATGANQVFEGPTQSAQVRATDRIHLYIKTKVCFFCFVPVRSLSASGQLSACLKLRESS